MRVDRPADDKGNGGGGCDPYAVCDESDRRDNHDVDVGECGADAHIREFLDGEKEGEGGGSRGARGGVRGSGEGLLSEEGREEGGEEEGRVGDEDTGGRGGDEEDGTGGGGARAARNAREVALGATQGAEGGVRCGVGRAAVAAAMAAATVGGTEGRRAVTIGQRRRGRSHWQCTRPPAVRRATAARCSTLAPAGASPQRRSWQAPSRRHHAAQPCPARCQGSELSRQAATR